MDDFKSKRVTIADIPNGLQVNIRPGWAWQDVVAAVFPIGFCLLGFWYVDVQASVKSYPATLILVIGFAGVTLWLSGIRFWWLGAGKETITAADGVLLMTRRGVIGAMARQSCTLADAKGFTTDRETGYWGRRYHPRHMGRRGTVHFTCNDENYRFGDMLSEDEGLYIIEQLRAKKLIS